MWKQIKPFDQTLAGKQVGMCEKNVRLGFGAPAVTGIDCAWAEWQHTDQHSGTPPAGVDVVVFFQYWAVIGGIYKNWGHVGVRLKNGKFWSDGTTYDSIQVYEAKHKPRYVGYSTHINGVEVMRYIADHPETVKPTLWNVRSTNSTSGSILGQVHGGDRYNTVLVDNNWRKITFNGKTGYVGPAAW